MSEESKPSTVRVCSRVIKDTGKRVVVQGIAQDLESNVLSTAKIKESLLGPDGKPYDEDIRVLIVKLALQKAKTLALHQLKSDLKALLKKLKKERDED